MDPFVQHFNNVFRSVPVYRVFEECTTALERLAAILEVPYVTQLRFSSKNDAGAKFQYMAYPGVKALPYAVMQSLYKAATNKVLAEGQTDQFYEQQLNHLLSLLEYVRTRLIDAVYGAGKRTQQGDISLLELAFQYQLLVKYDSMQATPGQDADAAQKALQSITAEIAHRWFNAQECDGIDTLLHHMERHLAHTHGAFAALLGFQGSFIQQLNKTLLARGYTQITIEILPSHLTGAESALSLQQFKRISALAQRHFSTPGQFFSANALCCILGYARAISDSYPQYPVKQAINQLVKEQIEHQILNTVCFTEPAKALSFLTYLLTGVVYEFDEQEFYLNSAVCLRALFQLINTVMAPSHKIETAVSKARAARKATITQSCKATPLPSEEDPTAKEFYTQIGELTSVLQPYVQDQIFNEPVEFTFKLKDQDLRTFLDQLGGLQKLYSAVLGLWLQFKSLFRNDDVNYLFEGVQQLIIKANDINSPLAPLLAELDQCVNGLELQDGLQGVNQLLSIIRKQLVTQQDGCIVVDEIVGGPLYGPGGQPAKNDTQDVVEQAESEDVIKITPKAQTDEYEFQTAQAAPQTSDRPVQPRAAELDDNFVTFDDL